MKTVKKYKTNLLKTFKTVNVNGLSMQEDNIKKIIRKWTKKNISNSTSELDNFGNLLITVNGKGKKELAFTTHLDVVSDIGTICLNKRLMRLCIKENWYNSNKILGADSRGGIAIILNIVKDLDRKCYKKLHILFTISEEHGFRGIQNADMNLYKNVESIISCDRPVCYWKENKGNVVNCHLKNGASKLNDNLLKLWRSAKKIRRKVICHNANHRNAYTGGDASFIRGYDVFDFTCGTKYQHTSRETLSLKDFFTCYKLMLSFSQELLRAS